MESNNFVNYLKQNGVSARRLAYCENNCDFKQINKIFKEN